jgi:hypothetical protein
MALGTEQHLRAFPDALRYFALVFGAGFLLAFIRIPLLVPRYGVRIAELIEIPVMLVVIAFASRWIERRATYRNLLATGILALIFMLAAELTGAALTGGGSPLAYVAAKDPVSGSAYLVSLIVFALAPWAWSKKSRA